MEKRDILHEISNKLTLPMTVLGKGVELGVHCKEAIETIREMMNEMRNEVKDETTDE